MNVLKMNGNYKKYPIIDNYTCADENKNIHYVIKILEVLDNGQEKIHKLTSLDEDKYLKAIKNGYLELRLPMYNLGALDE